MTKESGAATPEASAGVGQRALRSGIWLWGRQIVTNLVSLVTMGILARQLAPSAFGAVAVANVVLRFIVVLSKAGVGDFVIVDKKEGNLARASAAFWLNMCLTVVVIGVGLVALPWIVLAYHEPLLKGILLVFFFKYFVDQLMVVPDALIRRSLDYHKLVLRDGTLEVVASVLSCVLALTGFGVWALVLPHLAIEPLRFAIVMAMSRWRPKLRLDTAQWPLIARFSGNVLVQQIANLIANDSDNLVIGKVLGNTQVGIYNNAWAATGLVAQNTAGIAGTLVLPSLAAAHTDPERLRQAFRRVVRVLAIMSIPAFTGMFVLAEEFVYSLYGHKWTAMVTPLRILILFAVRRAMGSPASAIYSVVGRPDIGMRLSLAFVPIYLPCLIAGTHWGILGVAWAVTITRTLWSFVAYRYMFALIGETTRGMWKQVGPVIWSSFIMGAVVLAAKLGVGHFVQLPAVVGLLTWSTLGAVVYVVLLRVGFTPVRREVLQLARELSPRVGTLVKRILGA